MAKNIEPKCPNIASCLRFEGIRGYCKSWDGLECSGGFHGLRMRKIVPGHPGKLALKGDTIRIAKLSVAFSKDLIKDGSTHVEFFDMGGKLFFRFVISNGNNDYAYKLCSRGPTRSLFAYTTKISTIISRGKYSVKRVASENYGELFMVEGSVVF